VNKKSRTNKEQCDEVRFPRPRGAGTDESYKGELQAANVDGGAVVKHAVDVNPRGGGIGRNGEVQGVVPVLIRR
jgi:hypothetical protein